MILADDSTNVLTYFQVIFALTGFGKFDTVEVNPTEVIVKKFPAYLEENPLPFEAAVDRCFSGRMQGEAVCHAQDLFPRPRGFSSLATPGGGSVLGRISSGEDCMEWYIQEEDKKRTRRGQRSLRR
eukprot:761600-Hanusia_phi.AAC.2